MAESRGCAGYFWSILPICCHKGYALNVPSSHVRGCPCIPTLANTPRMSSACHTCSVTYLLSLYSTYSDSVWILCSRQAVVSRFPHCVILCCCHEFHRLLPLPGKMPFILQVRTQMPPLLWCFPVFPGQSPLVAFPSDLPQHCVHVIFIALITHVLCVYVLILQGLLICVSSVRTVSAELIFTGWMCKVLC